MTGSARLRPVVIVGLILALIAANSFQGVQGENEEEELPSEIKCRPYIEKALKDRDTGIIDGGSKEDENGPEKVAEDVTVSQEEEGESKEQDDEQHEDESQENASEESAENKQDVTTETLEEVDDQAQQSEEQSETKLEDQSAENVKSAEATDSKEDQTTEATEIDTAETIDETHENVDASTEAQSETTKEIQEDDETQSTETEKEMSRQEDEEDEKKDDDKEETEEAEQEATEAVIAEEADSGENTVEVAAQSVEEEGEKEVSNEAEEAAVDQVDSESEATTKEDDGSVEKTENLEVEEKSTEQATESTETQNTAEVSGEENVDKAHSEEEQVNTEEDKQSTEQADEPVESKESDTVSSEKPIESEEAHVSDEKAAKSMEDATQEQDEATETSKEAEKEETTEAESAEKSGEGEEEKDSKEVTEPTPEEDLIQEIEIPENLRPRDHVNQILRLDQDNAEKEAAIAKVADIVLKELKRLYDTAIKPLETLYKYRDLSNRHFGDPEIFSKPLVLFMGPWSGGKSSIINYLLDIEYKQTALRTGAEPSPAYFNILMHGEEEEVLDGTQLAADWTFSGLQKFGQGLLDRLRGLKLNNKLLEKINIVEIPGILEIRKQVQRLFPFNDACQWFIDRADIIFLVYDPSKLDVGPETEAILDQLKGREYQTRIILNKADQVKPEELMRVQGALIWNISPLMSSAEPPIMYSTSLWSMPYEAGAPTRLLYAQERAFLRDLRSAIDKRVEHKIASARRFAVRVRNHAKMVDCYLTTYYNHKSFFGSKKEISDRIIENPQEYHIYEGLSTLTNISRYDLPDPDVYRDFFRLNNLYEFPLLSSTCTYFRGCPINRLDVAIAYDLPELVGKYKKSVEAAIQQEENQSVS
ncbi:sarcalumenin [Chelonus insularis]|uniref:sarcalumenin n=1 Tax=Chelonus insularis TaxID=460826 RepID=UPI00158B8984|nr:sarcalumenin [Chelonus insularis]